MSLALLGQTYDEARRLAIAGSMVAPGDFRLKKLIAPLEQAGAKAPVFARVAQGTAKVVESNERTAGEALLELGSLVSAILYTQGTTGAEGALEPIASVDLGAQETQTSARTLKPLLEALTSTGSGRMEVIVDAHNRGLFRDMRLVRPAVAAIDDGYREIGDFIAEKVLPLYGPSIAPELEATYDAKAKNLGAGRRLALLHRIDPARARPLVEKTLEEGSKENRVVAIGCLGESPEDLATLLDSAKAKARDVRMAALRGLARRPEAASIEAILTALRGPELPMAATQLANSPNAAVAAVVRKECAEQFDALFTIKEKRSEAAGRTIHLIRAIGEREDAETAALLIRMFEKYEKLGSMPNGKDVRSVIASAMETGPKAAAAVVAKAHEQLSADDVEYAFRASIRVQTPQETFDAFSPYVTSGTGGKKSAKGAVGTKRDVIMDCLTFDAYSPRSSRIKEIPDPRWVDVGIAIGDADVVADLAPPGHGAALGFLADKLERQIKVWKSHVPDLETIQLCAAVIRLDHPRATDFVIAMLRKSEAGNVYIFPDLILKLPTSSAPALEAALPSLDEKLANVVAGYIAELKSKAT